MADSTPAQDAIRATVRTLEARAKADAAFAQQVQADPVGTLTAAGIPTMTAQEIVAASPLRGDVAGYLMDQDPCPEGGAQTPSCFYTHWTTM